MLKNYKKKSASKSESGQVKSSFHETLEEVREQIDVNSFCDMEYIKADEIAMIITEVYVLPKDTPVRIGGIDLEAGMVADIYHELSSNHVEEVLNRYKAIPYDINHVKTYLRTTLYNSVFELSARYVNNMRQKDAT
ncbi:MAG: DUF6017 domain-containing protein [Oscillospiraceae bacterium]|nr:DUF6017 domain-containing protein [Oscillospiraceae bacterium]